jgi:membrane protein
MSAGSLLSTILTIAASAAFNYYVNHFSHYNTLYGSIGTLMIIMIWINFNALAVIIGFELNASILGAKKKINGENGG